MSENNEQAALIAGAVCREELHRAAARCAKEAGDMAAFEKWMIEALHTQAELWALTHPEAQAEQVTA